MKVYRLIVQVGSELQGAGKWKFQRTTALDGPVITSFTQDP